MVIVAEGMANTAGLLLTDVGGTAHDYVGIGTGSTAANVADTWLETQYLVNAGTGTRITTTQTDDTAQITATLNISNDATAITEYIIATAATDGAGTCLCHSVQSAINLNNGDSLQVVYKVQIKQGS